MTAYWSRRLITSLVTLLLVSIFVFGIIHLIPGDPAVMILGQEASPENLERLRRRLGLDQPIGVQYFNWMRGVLSGNLGTSLSTDQSVASLLRERLPATVTLAGAALLVAVGMGVPLGILAAVKRGGTTDAVISLIAFSGLCIPQFWLGILLILFFSLRAGLLPPGGYVNLLDDVAGGLTRLILPAIALGTTLAALLMRMTRSNMLEVIGQDYIRTARAKGASEASVILRHALKNAFIPTLTVMALQLGYLLGGAVVIEEVFYWPGLGRLLLHAINYRDFPLLQGVTLLIASSYVVLNFVADLLYMYLDPRIRFE